MAGSGRSQSELVVGLVGAGRIAVTAHAPAWARIPDARIAWVVDEDAQRAEALAREFGIERWTDDLSEVLSDESVAAVDICTPLVSHVELALAALAAGKDILLEKPLAPSLEDAARLLDAASASDRVLMIAENWPYSDVYQYVEPLLRDGVIGRPYMLKVKHESATYAFDRELPDHLQPHEAVGGNTLTAGIHAINLSRFLMGEFAELCAFSNDPAPSSAPFLDRNVVVAATFESGATASITITGTSKHLGERHLGFTVFGTDGVLEFDILSGLIDCTSGGKRTQVELNPCSFGWNEEVEHFRDCVKSRELPRTNAPDQLRTLAVVDAIYRSIFSGSSTRPFEASKAGLENGAEGR